MPIVLVATLALAGWLGLFGFVLALGRVAARADSFAAARRCGMSPPRPAYAPRPRTAKPSPL